MRQSTKWKWAALAGGVLLVAGHGSAAAQEKPSTVSSRVLLVADPQLHNVYGGSIKSMTRFSDRHVANVAIRPPILDLLAPLALQKLVESARGGMGFDLAVVLGDMANIACSGELSDFDTVLSDALKPVIAGERPIPWIAVHGNHDSFMAGNFQNVERPRSGDTLAELFPPSQAACGSLPPCVSTGAPPSTNCCTAEQFSGWTADEGRAYAYDTAKENSWPQACARPAKASVPANKDSVPANKHVWLAWYLKHLVDLGVEITIEAKQHDGQASYFPIIGKAAEGTPLALRDFAVSGRWYLPALASESRRRWWSYIVQSIDLSVTKRLILVDTSVFGNKSLGGLSGALGWPQLDDIDDHVTKARARKLDVVSAGHMPLNDLKRGDRKKLLAFGFDEYDSAHTHAPAAIGKQFGTYELNIGSTTDWPMELGVRDFSKKLMDPQNSFVVHSFGVPDPKWPGQKIPRRTIDLPCNKLQYLPGNWTGAFYRPQACAHLGAATLSYVLLQDPSLANGWVENSGSDCQNANQVKFAADVVAAAYQKLAGATAAARTPLLCIMKAASKAEGIQYDPSVLIAPWNARRQNM